MGSDATTDGLKYEGKYASRMVCVLAGGVGAARFLRGLREVVEGHRITAVVNTGDDTILHGLNISPDIDTVTYTLADEIDPDRGWGLRGETWRAMEALGRFTDVRPHSSEAAPRWFNLGDSDLATHFYRTARLREGATLTEVTDEIRRAFRLDVRIVPMCDTPVRTEVTVDSCDSEVSGQTISFQEYFVRYQHSVPVAGIHFRGADTAECSALEHIASDDAVVIAPSNPIVSIGPIRALAGVDEALARRRDSVVAVSPIVAGAALKGPADRMLVELGHEASVVGVARMYAPIAGTLVIDTTDEHLAKKVEAEGIKCVVTRTIMKEPGVGASLATAVLDAANSTPREGRS